MSFYSHEKIYGTDGLITLVPLTLNSPPGIPSHDITHYEHMISEQSIISRPGQQRYDQAAQAATQARVHRFRELELSGGSLRSTLFRSTRNKQVGDAWEGV